MLGTIGFSYVGVVYLLMLMIPNILWIKKQPLNYSSDNENNILVMFEKIGEVFVSCVALIFSDFNLKPWTTWSWWLVISFIVMLLYEIWWVRYFKSKRTLQDFYRNLLFVPVAGATLPVIAFALLGIYGKNLWMLIAVAILGIGHIGIHLQHSFEIRQK